eukprot:TRINITY_DN20410_c0_g1_i1.p1 TRINITY_DN20410_c0_g1~~TRINITY_DN20410_c0_g1_i1.p1  ORF type:complete len:597 (+),score=203.20 TRINITY_DN20410_c0_g1_i1:86-1792(+)
MSSASLSSKQRRDSSASASVRQRRDSSAAASTAAAGQSAAPSPAEQPLQQQAQEQPQAQEQQQQQVEPEPAPAAAEPAPQELQRCGSAASAASELAATKRTAAPAVTAAGPHVDLGATRTSVGREQLGATLGPHPALPPAQRESPASAALMSSVRTAPLLQLGPSAPPAAGAAAAALQEENSRLAAQVDALQRMLQDRSAEARLGRLQDDLQDKVRRIKVLEREKADLRKEVDRLRGSADAAAGRRQQRASLAPSLGPSGDPSEGAAEAARLRAELRKREEEARAKDDTIARLEGAAAAARSAAAASDDQAHIESLQSTVCTLRQAVVERDTALARLAEKLRKAHEAIVASVDGDAGFKLQHTRVALERLLSARERSCSAATAPLPGQAAAAGGAQRSVSQGAPPPPRMGVAAVLGSVHLQAAGGGLVSLTATAPAQGRGALLRSGADVPAPAPVTALAYDASTGMLVDQCGRRCVVPQSARSDGTLARLAAMCDACNVAHDLRNEAARACRPASPPGAPPPALPPPPPVRQQGALAAGTVFRSPRRSLIAPGAASPAPAACGWPRPL